MTNSGKIAWLAGGSGLVGSQLLKVLDEDSNIQVCYVFGRSEMRDLSSKFHFVKTDFENIQIGTLTKADYVFCTLGTTIKKAGSRERFREFDYGYPLQIARLGLQQGAQHFLLVSALGADARSRIFYNRVKGELEEAMVMLPYRSITIARPSLLLGPRQELRPAEAIGQRLGFLLPERYKPIDATAVATVLVEAARQDRPGTRIFESTDIKAQAQHLLHS